jgi:hypothetical protein
MRGDHIAAGFLYGSLDTRGWEAGIAAVRRGGASGAEKRRDVARVMRRIRVDVKAVGGISGRSTHRSVIYDVLDDLGFPLGNRRGSHGQRFRA